MRLLTRYLFLLASCALACAQTPAPDEIVFTNGDKLAGKFVKATGANVTFKSDALGDITVDWKKVKELHTSAEVAVVKKGVKLRKNGPTGDVPQGTLQEADQHFLIAPAPGQTPQSIPVGEANVVIDQPAFQKAVAEKPPFIKDWTGTVTLGAAIVTATQDSETFTGALHLVRAEPSENWLDPSNRTIFDASDSFGEVTQPNTPTIKTSIFHFGLERDQYFTPTIFAFGEAYFDHNYSQGLEIQQTYAGGAGWTVVKNANTVFDLKAGMSFIDQEFLKGPSMQLVGSSFGFTFNQTATVIPAWNNTNAWSAAFAALLTMPVYKHLSGSLGATDTFLNDPPAGFKKNSLQITLGLTYAIQ
jgi:Protein of unknown function, DUF481